MRRDHIFRTAGFQPAREHERGSRSLLRDKRLAVRKTKSISLTRHGACSTLGVGELGEFRMLRRSLLASPLLASPLLLAATPAWAEWMPKQPIHVIVGFAPGGTADIAARLAGEAIQRRAGHTVVVDNKSGALGF